MTGVLVMRRSMQLVESEWMLLLRKLVITAFSGGWAL